jgi:hypothetical protein
MADEQQQQQARGSTSITCHVCTTASTVATVPVPLSLALFTCTCTVRPRARSYDTIYSCTRYSLLYHVLCTIEAVCEPMRIYAAAAGCEPRADTGDEGAVGGQPTRWGGRPGCEGTL